MTFFNKVCFYSFTELKLDVLRSSRDPTWKLKWRHFPRLTELLNRRCVVFFWDGWFYIHHNQKFCFLTTVFYYFRCSKTPTKRDQPNERWSSPRRRKGGKEGLLQNIDDFSYGLQAIEDLQENIERELKSTRMVRLLNNGNETLIGSFTVLPFSSFVWSFVIDKSSTKHAKMLKQHSMRSISIYVGLDRILWPLRSTYLAFKILELKLFLFLFSVVQNSGNSTTGFRQ